MPYYFISRIILIATKRYYFQDKRVDILSCFHYVLCKLAIYVIWYILALCWSSTANIVWRIRLRMKYWKVWISRLIEWFRYYFFFSKAVLLISGNLNHPAKPFAIAKDHPAKKNKPGEKKQQAAPFPLHIAFLFLKAAIIKRRLPYPGAASLFFKNDGDEVILLHNIPFFRYRAVLYLSIYLSLHK